MFYKFTIILLIFFTTYITSIARVNQSRNITVKTAPIKSNIKPVQQSPKPIAKPITTTKSISNAFQPVSTTQKPPMTSSFSPFNTGKDNKPFDKHDKNHHHNYPAAILVPVYIPYSSQSVQQDSNYQSSNQNQMDQQAAQTQILAPRDQSQSDNQQPYNQPNTTQDQTLNYAISLPPTLNCPSMPTNNDSATMNYFRQEKFNTDFTKITIKSNNCLEQCKTDAPGKCYTGVTSNNQCECATPKTP